ncbi:MAG: hypothetical protein AAF741_15690 [Bacteroidota bacterium]
MDNQSNLLGYAEVADTLADTIEVYRIIKEPLSDGIDFTDILPLYEAYPRLREIFSDRQTFVAELLDLTPQEATLALDQVAQRVGVARDQVEYIALRSFDIASRVYRLAIHNISEINLIRAEFALIGKMGESEGPLLLEAA